MSKEIGKYTKAQLEEADDVMMGEKNDCPFCAGKAVAAEYCGSGIQTMGMMLGSLFGKFGEDDVHEYAYNGIMLKRGNMLCFDNSAGEYAELAINIKHCPFCGRTLRHKKG